MCLLYDNRIFAFKQTNGADAGSGSSSREQNLLLNMITTPNFRIMSSLYVLFRLIDDVNLVAIIALSFMNGTFALAIPTADQIALLAAFSVDAFYEVMMGVNRYWFLQRLSIYVGFALYAIYAAIISWKFANPDDGIHQGNNLQLVLFIVGLRFVAFIFEELSTSRSTACCTTIL